MLPENSHIANQELLLVADGELSQRRAAEVRAHLTACWDCRARMAEVERTITDFARAHRRELDSQLPPIDGSRASLRAQLNELTAQPDSSMTGSARRFFRFAIPVRKFAYLCLALFAMAFVSKLALEFAGSRALTLGSSSEFAVSDRSVVPDRTLTPGATRVVTVSDVCSMVREEVVRAVPNPLRQEIFREYGIANARASDYEIDYLIAPGLGGTEDMRNLWPEPYRSATWNARVKDDLEERLHEMVCSGKVDLYTAQHDIATNWISAYMKYFHTERPLSINSALTGYDVAFTVPLVNATGSLQAKNLDAAN